MNNLRNLGQSMVAASAVCLLCATQTSAVDVPPLEKAHAHNDYYHDRPLLDALSKGFCSVEADVFLVDGELLVAHSRDELEPQRTLRQLYLEPLKRRSQQNDGRIYRQATLTLLVDIKSDGPSTYRVLEQLLMEYAPILTSFENGKVTDRAVVVIISGNRPIELMAEQEQRLAFVDGRLSDLDRELDVKLMPLISDRWGLHFSWTGNGPLPAEERAKLRSLVARGHRRGQRLRFWGTPDQLRVWEALFDADVDLINTDDLSGLWSFLRSKQR